MSGGSSQSKRSTKIMWIRLVEEHHLTSMGGFGFGIIAKLL